MEALSKAQAGERAAQIRGWQLSNDGKCITKTLLFKDWQEAFAFATRVSEIAEHENHHPDMDVHWGKVGISLSTHSAGGLTEKDFIVAAKIDTL